MDASAYHFVSLFSSRACDVVALAAADAIDLLLLVVVLQLQWHCTDAV